MCHYCQSFYQSRQNYLCVFLFSVGIASRWKHHAHLLSETIAAITSESFGIGRGGEDFEVEESEVNSVAAEFEAQFSAIVTAEGDGASSRQRLQLWQSRRQLKWTSERRIFHKTTFLSVFVTFL